MTPGGGREGGRGSAALAGAGSRPNPRERLGSHLSQEPTWASDQTGKPSLSWRCDNQQSLGEMIKAFYTLPIPSLLAFFVGVVFFFPPASL